MNMPEFKHCTLSVEDGIAVFTICREEKMNAQNNDVWADMERFADFLEKTDEVRIGVITGAGNKAFIAGSDINDLERKRGIDIIHREGKTDTGVVLSKLENGRKPVIAAINGYCLGGGMEVALACDIRIVSENARLGLPETDLGVIPGAGGTQRLARVAGLGIAKQMILTGKLMTGEEAVMHNLAMKCVPQESLMEEVFKVAKRMIKKGPLALEFAKKAINASLDTDEKTGLYIERLTMALLMDSEDKKEGTRAFIEKRPANFIGK